MYSVMPGTCIFRFKVAMAANSKICPIWLRKILNIFIKQWLAINQLNDIQGLIRHQKWFRLIVFDIGSKMVTKLKIAAVSRKIHVNTKHIWFTLLWESHNIECFIYSEARRYFKGVVVTCMYNYRLIVLWKAQMAANISPPISVR